MKNKKNILYIIVILILIIILAIIVYFAIPKNQNNTDSNFNSSSSSTSTTTETKEIVSTSGVISQETNRGEAEYTNYSAEINLSSLTCNGTGVNISGTTITISTAGTYYFTGTLNEGNIVIKAGENDNVVLVFDNASITSSKTSVINGISANNIIINLKSGSTNTFTDSSNYTEFTDTDEPDATIFSKTDLLFNGKGTLIINANYKDAIASKDDLIITNVTLQINSVDDGLRGKDSVDIMDSYITINSKGDGIKATNDTETEKIKGYVIINGGEVSITSQADGIQAETIINLSNVKIKIETTGDISDSTVSSKGLKASKEITINSGDININSTDDSIHSNYYVIINGGNLTLSSSDDGIHADTNITINGGTIKITKSYEGIEASYIEINDGDISIIASDDGLNATDGSGSSEFGGRMESISATSNVELVINGGKVYMNSQGDGLDANGSITMNSGEVIVVGTTSGGNGALDYDKSFNVNGGNLIVYGSTGMWQNPSTTSKQYSISFSYSGNVGDKIELKDSNGNTIASFTLDKSCQAIVISNSNLIKDESYTLYANGNSISSQQLSNIVTSNVSTQDPGGGPGGMGSPGMMNGGGKGFKN